LASIDTYYDVSTNRYNFIVPIISLNPGAMSINRNILNTVGGPLQNLLSVENDSIINTAVVNQEVITGNGTLMLTPKNGQLVEILSVQNFSAKMIDSIPANTNFIKLSKAPITNMAGNGLGAYGDSSITILETNNLIFAQEVNPANIAQGAPILTQPGQYYVNYQEGYIQTYTKTPRNETNQQISYTYLADYNLNFVQISSDQTSFTLNGPVNAGLAIPQATDYILTSYSWSGNGMPLTYRLECFSSPNGVLDLSFLTASQFNGPIYINGITEIQNIKTHPTVPFYAYDPTTDVFSVVGYEIQPTDEILFQFNTPIGNFDLYATAYNLENRQNVSRFTFNVDSLTFNVTTIEYLQTGGMSVSSAPGMTINAGATVVNQPKVVVQLAAMNAQYMILSQDSLFRDKTDLDFVNFSTAQIFNLTPVSSATLQTIYAKITFENTGIQDVILSASITLDPLSNIGFVELNNLTDFSYSASDRILKTPTSFGQSDIVINSLESIVMNSLTVNINQNTVTQTFS
jgi:hypothetical protein